jgi:ankyrin repeat protein
MAEREQGWFLGWQWMLHFLHIRSRLFLSLQFWISAHEPDIPQMSNLRDTLTQREEILLLSAAAYGDLAAVKYLIEEKAVQIDCTNSKEETPLLLACCYGHVEIVDYLLDHRANAALEGKLGENPRTTFPASHLNTSTGLRTGCGQAMPH